jgi:alpha-glucosidase (family GH31 glycosyl hydrolase)
MGGVLVLASTFSASPAGAAILVGSRTVLVGRPGDEVLVSRHPFRLEFLNRSSRPVLSEVANRKPAPSPLSPTQDPVPPGTEPRHSGQLYAPMSFLVGNETLSQYQGGVWGGNLMSGERSGVQYAARDVAGVRRSGAGAVLTVSTNDPSGRKLEVKLMPLATGLFSVTVSAHPSRGIALMSDAFASSPSEAFYGFGGRHNALNQHGQNLASFVEEENIVGLGTKGTPSAVLFPNGPTAAYYPQAQFISSRGYGFFLDGTQPAWFRMDSDQSRAWSVAARGSDLHYFVSPRGGTRGIGAVTSLTGRQRVPPAWALGPMLDRLIKNVGESQANYQSELKSDIKNIDRYHLPLTAYRIEGWGLKNPNNDGLAIHSYVSFALQQRIIAELRARHIHPLAYLRPWITPGSEPDRQGLTVRTSTGSTYEITGTAGQQIALLDFTNPAAVRYWRGVVAKVLNLGFDGFMSDFGEEVLADMHFHNGQTGIGMHNRYLVLYMRATREAVNAYEARYRGRHIWFFNRAGYSGTPGSAAYEGGNFPGDETTDWSQAAGLASLAPDMLGRAIGGAYGYATDIGGYYDYTTPPTTKQLFLRWAEWAALSPIFRLHGSGRSGTHTPWSYDKQTVRAYVALSKLHERAAPLIMRLWREAERTGIPPTRPLWLQFPGDRRAAAQTQEWMLGANVLVAPVVVEGATSRSVYFPAGCWRLPWSGREFHGRRSAMVRASLTQLPYFLRCGSKGFAG